MHIMFAVLHVRLVAGAGVRTQCLLAPCTQQALVTVRRLIFGFSLVVIIVNNLTVRHHRHWCGARHGYSPVPFLLPIISSICPAPR